MVLLPVADASSHETPIAAVSRTPEVYKTFNWLGRPRAFAHRVITAILRIRTP